MSGPELAGWVREGTEAAIPIAQALAVLLAAWLRWALDVPVDLTPVAGPGITQVQLDTRQGLITLARPDGAVALLSRPGVPDSTIALPRRGLPDLLSEELRRLDPDEVYGDVLHSLGEPTWEVP